MALQQDETAKRLRLARNIADKYQHINSIDSVAVGGSTAIGSAHSDSDLDMWVTYSVPPTPQQTSNTIRQLVEEHGNEPQPTYLIHGHVNVFRLEGVDVVVQLGPNEAVLQLPDKVESMI